MPITYTTVLYRSC